MIHAIKDKKITIKIKDFVNTSNNQVIIFLLNADVLNKMIENFIKLYSILYKIIKERYHNMYYGILFRYK